MRKKQKTFTISEMIRKRKNDLSITYGYLNLLFRILMVFLTCCLIFTNIFLITRTNGNDMFPAVKDGDLLLAFRLQQEYRKDDVVIYKEGNSTLVGRIVAKENDVVTLDESGTLLVNGTVQSGEILYPTYAKDTLEYPYVVPENHVFILGDYRTQAVDSRDFGSVPVKHIKGKVITIIRRRGI